MTSEEKWVNVNGEPQIPRKYFDYLVAVKGPNFQPNPKLFCVICQTANHHSHECRRYRSSKAFWEKVLQDRRCKNCLRLFHRSNTCFNRSLCNVPECKRKDKHSPIVCFARYSIYQYFPKYHKNYGYNASQNHVFEPFYFQPRRQNVKRKFNIKPLPHQSNVPQIVKVDAATQVVNNEDQKPPLTKDVLSKGSQIEKSTVTVSTQTSLTIPPLTDPLKYSSSSTEIKPQPSHGKPTQKIAKENDVNVSDNLHGGSLRGIDAIECSLGDLKINTTSLNKASTQPASIHRYSDDSKDNAGIVKSSKESIQVSQLPNFIRSAVDKYAHTMSKVLEQQPPGFSSFPHWK